MAYLLTVDIQCEHEGCLNWIFGEAGLSTRGPQLYAQARRRAKEHGWAYRAGKDYCPEHTPKVT